MEDNQSTIKLSKETITKSLLKIKSSKGPIQIKNIEQLIRLGLVAGDHNRPYLTDIGDTYLGFSWV